MNRRLFLKKTAKTLLMAPPVVAGLAFTPQETKASNIFENMEVTPYPPTWGVAPLNIYYQLLYEPPKPSSHGPFGQRGFVAFKFIAPDGLMYGDYITLSDYYNLTVETIRQVGHSGLMDRLEKMGLASLPRVEVTNFAQFYK